MAPDALGSVRQVVDPAGSVTLAQSYDPFGNPLTSAGSDSSAFGYTGEQVDASTGLVYLRARYYISGTGRFLTPDPWTGEPLDPRSLPPAYLYVGDNPINHVDPSGLTEWRESTSGIERIIERVYEQGRPDIHLEFPLPTWRWRPDILNSSTGEVFEIKPL